MGLKSILVCFQITSRLFHRRRKKILSSKRRSILEVWYNVSYSFIHVLVFFFTFLSGSLFFVDVYASVVWGRLGHARISCRLVLLLVSMAWEV